MSTQKQSKPKTTRKPKKNEIVEETKVTEEPKIELKNDEETVDAEDKTTKKAGRTLLVKALPEKNFNSSFFETLSGLINKSETKTTNSYFLTFDTINNAVSAYNSLSKQPNCLVKYSYYRIYFTIEGLNDNTDYNDFKQKFGNYINTNAKTEMLYCKLYRKQGKFIGCGDFTVDTMDGMNKLLSKENGLKTYVLDNYKGNFYRFNTNKKKTNISQA